MQPSRRPKSAVRKPLSELPIGPNPRTVAKPSRGVAENDDALRRLQLVRSDLAALIRQIDQLTVDAMSEKTISKKGSQEIDSLRHMLSDMYSSLKPWTSRLQQAFADGSTLSVSHPNNYSGRTSVYGVHGFSNTAPSKNTETELELVVSPSPLVSWRADSSSVDCGRQLFLLTPLPNSKLHSTKMKGSSKGLTISFGPFGDEEQSGCRELLPTSKSTKVADSGFSGRAEANPATKIVHTPFSFQPKVVASDGGYVSPVNFSNQKSRTIRLLTPHIPKLTATLDVISESCQQSSKESSLELGEKSNKDNVSDDHDSEELQVKCASDYPDFLVYQPGSKPRRRGAEADETLNWFLSPPKTCVLMEASEEKLIPTPADTQLSIVTPVWKGLESTRRNKQPGEATLKRELWTQFDAVSSSGLGFDVSVFQKPRGKGFLDRLEEVSLETEDSSVQTER